MTGAIQYLHNPASFSLGGCSWHAKPSWSRVRKSSFSMHCPTCNFNWDSLDPADWHAIADLTERYVKAVTADHQRTAT